MLDMGACMYVRVLANQGFMLDMGACMYVRVRHA